MAQSQAFNSILKDHLKTHFTKLVFLVNGNFIAEILKNMLHYNSIIDDIHR